MLPSNKLIVSDTQMKWFHQIAKACRNPKGGIYEFDLSQIFAQFPELEGKKLTMQNANFLLTKTPGLKNGFYLTIIDAKYLTQINQFRWVPKDDPSKIYWYTGLLFQKTLHQYILKISHGVLPRHVIHHSNFFAFDNRIQNFSLVTRSENGKLYKKANIINSNSIHTDPDFLKFINAMF